MKSLHVEKLSSSVHLDRASMITTVRIQARVQRTFDELETLLRPECWPRSPYFLSVHRVLRSKNGQPVARPGRGAMAFERDRTPQSDSTWAALYYEHVRVGATGGGSVEFHNLLDMEFEQTARYAELTFGLHECLASRWGALRRVGGLDVDRGYTRLERQPGGLTYVDAVKSLRYTPFAEIETAALGLLGASPHIANHLAPAFVGWWMEELVLGACSGEPPATPGAEARRSSSLPDAARARSTV